MIAHARVRAAEVVLVLSAVVRALAVGELSRRGFVLCGLVLYPVAVRLSSSTVAVDAMLRTGDQRMSAQQVLHRVLCFP